ncbi:MAG TPA: DUF1788 domain-containing protein [Dysgonamonadaceae bacterium]|jgi:hypothetical protein|nr:DUF1788 domain-containing protein [Dysgonamonadaceae bacterium]
MTLEESIYEKFSFIHKVVSQERFIRMEGLSGDIPFWIAPYDVKAEQQVNTEIGNLVKKLSNEGIRALAVDLFELSCELVEEHIGLEDMFALEQNMEKLFFIDALQSSINIHERFIPAISERIAAENPSMLFIKGVGRVFPFIRSHIVLNNLQSAVKNIPTLMFFPGEYSGKSLKLFNLLEDDNYYRANNIFSQKIGS